MRHQPNDLTNVLHPPVEIADDSSHSLPTTELDASLESIDDLLWDALLAEIDIHRELTRMARASVEMDTLWCRFSTESTDSVSIPTAYLEDRETKRLMVNLGINAITTGGFIEGVDALKIMRRAEYGTDEKRSAAVAVCESFLTMWLRTYSEDPPGGRGIVDLKPAQFVVAKTDHHPELVPAPVIDVGPADFSDDIRTFLPDTAYMCEVLPILMTRMLEIANLPGELERVLEELQARLDYQRHANGLSSSARLALEEVTESLNEYRNQ